MINTTRVPIDRKLAIIYSTLMLTLLAVTIVAFMTLERLGAASDRVATRYSPQLDRISDVQMLMFRISLEARHAMLVQAGPAREETFNRIGGFRKEMLDKLETFEATLSTPEGKANAAKIREADKLFWRLAGEVVGKIQAGDVSAAFAQLEGELVPARNVMVDHIIDQRQWQRNLVIKTVETARSDAKRANLIVLFLAVLGSVVAAWMSWSMVRMIRGAFQRAQRVTHRIAGGDLQENIYVRKGDEFGDLFGSISDMQQRLQTVVGRVRTVAGEIVQAAAAIDGANRELAAASRSHGDTVVQTSESARRVNEAVRDSAASVESVNRLATEAASIAERGGTVVGEVVSTMRGIDDASKRIGEIVGVIDGIAFQTNILALNAAVEAARAGDQGRGFAVVAGEVRSLAQRSASAAREVKTLIQDSVARVDSGAALADQAGQTMQRIVGAVTEVTQLMGEVAQSARRQHQDVAAVTGAVAGIGEASRQSLEAVARSTLAADNLRSHALELERAVAVFNVQQEV